MKKKLKIDLKIEKKSIKLFKNHAKNIENDVETGIKYEKNRQRWSKVIEKW